MNNELLIKGLLIGFASFGIHIVDIKINDDSKEAVICVTAPKEYTYTNSLGEIFTPENTVKKVKECLSSSYSYKIRMLYKMRDEVWTEEKRDEVLKKK